MSDTVNHHLTKCIYRCFYSQLLDLLLDINESNRVPPHLRYDLRSPTPDASAVPALEPDLSPNDPSDVKSALSALQEVKEELATGQITPTSYTRVEAALLDTINKPQALTRLDTTPHTTLQSVIPGYLPEDLDVDTPTGYLSPGHEEEYLSTLDISIGTSQTVPSRNLPPHSARSSDKHEKDKEAQLRNPVSVYNWLRKNQPQVFLQDNEVAPEKLAAKPQPVTKTPKRSSIAPKQEQEIIDEDGFVIGGLAEPSKPKRKREDEPYRPKGGSSRPTKKKKVSGGQNGKKGTDDQGN